MRLFDRNNYFAKTVRSEKRYSNAIASLLPGTMMSKCRTIVIWNAAQGRASGSTPPLRIAGHAAEHFCLLFEPIAAKIKP
jgi:hypothetical protein